MDKMKEVNFYFDYLSPYAYFAWSRLKVFCVENELKLVLRPVVFGKLLDHWGQLGPAEIQPKREWLARYCLFYATANKIPLSFPASHPFNSLPALRMSLKAVSGGHQAELVSAIFHAGWVEGKDLGDIDVLADVASSVGLNSTEIVASINEDAVKDMLRVNTEKAIAAGVFGVPTMIFENELFWGNDQFDYLAQVVCGDYKTNHQLLNEILSHRRAIDRNIHKK
jgi:2-hydroxychromene-2-carboxylate isomerase